MAVDSAAVKQQAVLIGHDTRLRTWLARGQPARIEPTSRLAAELAEDQVPALAWQTAGMRFVTKAEAAWHRGTMVRATACREPRWVR